MTDRIPRGTSTLPILRAELARYQNLHNIHTTAIGLHRERIAGHEAEIATIAESMRVIRDGLADCMDVAVPDRSEP